MSDLREKVRAPEKWNDGQYTTAMERQMYEMGVEDAFRIFERTAVERERQAFMEGWKYGALFDKSDYVTEASRRYPLPKEE